MARQRSKSQDMRMATWNVSSMVSRSGEVVDALQRRKIDFCCAQEARWRGESARMLGANGRRCKFFWQGCNKGTAGVGVFIAERWIDSVVNVVGVNERIMYVKPVIGKQIVNIVSAYAPQVGLSAEEKDDFWDSFIIVLSGIPKQESIFIGSDMNGHVGRDADGYGGMGFSTRNAEGGRILEFGEAVGMVVYRVGRPRKTWLKSVEADMAELDIDKEDVHDRSKWRRNVNVMKRKSNPIV